MIRIFPSLIVGPECGYLWPLIIQQGCKLIDHRSSAAQVAICLSPRIHFEVSEHLFVSDDGIFMRFLLNSTLHRIRT